MTETKQMIEGMNTVLKALGEPELTVPEQGESGTELELLRRVKEEYAERLRRQKPLLRGLPEKLIPDSYLQAFLKRERELELQ